MQLRSYQIEGIDALWAEICTQDSALCALPTGCVSGDTIIRLNIAKKGYSRTIKKAYKAQKDLHVNPNIETKIRGLLSDEKIGLVKVSGGISFSGKKRCIKVSSENRFIVLTPDHLIFTKEGWTRADQCLGKFFATDNHKAKKSNPKNKSKVRDSFVEAFKNGISLKELVSIYRFDPVKSKDLWRMDPKTHVIHHKDHNHYNNKIENLECLTKEDRLKHHAEELKENFNQGKLSWEKIIKIEDAGHHDTYDVVGAETESFTANDVVVHNSGKTEIIIGFIQKAIAAKPNIKITMLMGRITLVAQTARRFQNVFGLKVGIYCGSLNRKESSSQIVIASIHSVDVNKFPENNLIIVDEVHNFDQKNGVYLDFWERQLSFNPKTKLLGFTATPFRASGPIYGEKEIFKRIAYRKTIKELIAMGYLCEPKLKGSAHAFDVSNLRVRAGEYCQEDVDDLVQNKNLIEEQVTDALSRMPDRQCVVWACANIAHCNMVADELMRRFPLSVTTVHSKLKKDERGRNLVAFMNGSIKHMVFVSILSEGFDHPPIDCVVLMRPTRSPVLYVQTVGRGLRLAPGKQDCLVLDYGQVIKTMGPLDEPNVKGVNRGSDGEAPVKECPTCNTFVFAGVRECPECGHNFPEPAKPQEKLDKKAASDAPILSQKQLIQKITVTHIFAEMYESKAGNQCVKIVYSNYDARSVWGSRFGPAEFFSIKSPWAMEKLDKRLDEIKLDLPEVPFDGEICKKGKFEVSKFDDGKFDRILGVKILEEIADDPTSFNFGANEEDEPKPNSPADIGF